jgi:GNAT superfamily N-acetyltransferase
VKNAAVRVFTWWIPDSGRRSQILPAFFQAVVEAMLPHDEVYLAHDGDGTALWLAPGDQLGPDDMAVLAPRLAAVTEEYSGPLFELLEVMEQSHPTDRHHHYLFFLATRPEWQSQGIGSTLMRVVLDGADRAGIPAYLEASSERNRQLYLRHGFVDTGQIRLGDSPPLWTMWREPNPGR